MGISERRLSHEYGDLILHNSWRLENITIEHTRGEKTIDRGWNSVLQPDGSYKPLIKDSVDSSKTPFETMILLVPPQLLGTHEATDPDYVPSIEEDKKGFAGIDFSKGWNGSPIATACSPDQYLGIYNSLAAHGGKGILDDLVYGDIGVLDGHHRRRYAFEGPVVLKYVPIQIVPFPHEPSVVLDTWHLDGNVWTPGQVFECFKTPDKYADAKRTKFGVKGSDGVTRRILSTQPIVKIPLANLV